MEISNSVKIVNNCRGYKQLFDKVMVDIKIYSVETGNMRRGLARVGCYLMKLNKFDTVINLSNTCFIISKKQIPFSRSLNKETCVMDYF